MLRWIQRTTTEADGVYTMVVNIRLARGRLNSKDCGELHKVGRRK